MLATFLACASCHAPFQKTTHNRMFCSAECRPAYKKKPKFRQGPASTCEWCREEFRQWSRGAAARFCSIKCSSAYRRFLVKIISRRVRFTVACAECGIDIERHRCEIRGQNFCSMSCRSKWQAKNLRVALACIQCGCTFEVAAVLRTWAKYCSPRCRNSHHPRSARARKVHATAVPAVACEKCGYCEYPQILELHHRDGDHSNDNPENLQWLCPNDHRIADLVLKGRL